MDPTTATSIDVCEHCENIHSGVCPRIKAIEYHDNGKTKRVEYHDPNVRYQYAGPIQPMPFDLGPVTCTIQPCEEGVSFN